MNAKTHRLPAVVRVQVATLLATCTGENRDQGSIFSHEIRFAKLLASFTTISKSLILIRPFISLRKNGEGLLIVV